MAAASSSAPLDNDREVAELTRMKEEIEALRVQKEQVQQL
jgi:hypothetical protein